MNIFKKTHGSLQQNHPLASYTAWKIGGPAEYFYQPHDLKDLTLFLKNNSATPILFLGAATNVLIRDGGIKNIVVYLRGSLNELERIDQLTLRAEAGVSCSRLLQQALHFSMTEAAFLAGIPGTVGGALRMNAGAHGDSIWNHVTAVETINKNGIIRLRNAQEFVHGYREVSGLDSQEWFIAGHFNFASGDLHKTEQHIRDLLLKRKASQPLDLPSCGSVFRNPPNDHAARLIESCNLKGARIGDAMISERHANFIVNLGNATSDNVEELMEKIITTVEKVHATKLIPEVKIIGDKHQTE